ncbi:MAG: hypothetical protein GY868_08260 [Deltaproteobacteria bacterium]|nr:hypothetical protein [Deltaproteobacteria bacterium]
MKTTNFPMTAAVTMLTLLMLLLSSTAFAGIGDYVECFSWCNDYCTSSHRECTNDDCDYACTQDSWDCKKECNDLGIFDKSQCNRECEAFEKECNQEVKQCKKDCDTDQRECKQGQRRCRLECIGEIFVR